MPRTNLRIDAIAKLTRYFSYKTPRTQPAQEGRNRVRRTTNIYEGGLNKEEANAESKIPPARIKSYKPSQPERNVQPKRGEIALRTRPG